MSNKENKSKLFKCLGESLAKYGYNKKPKGHLFHRYNENGWEGVHLSTINHKDDFQVAMSVLIRFDNVEDMINSCDDFISEKMKKKTVSLGVELGNLSVGEYKLWEISSGDQVESVVNSMMSLYEQVGEPYLKKYSSIVSANEILSSDDSNAWMHSPVHFMRAMRSIAIEKILGFENIEEEINRRRIELKRRNDSGLSRFDKFINEIV